jgi:hypothetical protein
MRLFRTPLEPRAARDAIANPSARWVHRAITCRRVQREKLCDWTHLVRKSRRTMTALIACLSTVNQSQRQIKISLPSLLHGCTLIFINAPAASGANQAAPAFTPATEEALPRSVLKKKNYHNDVNLSQSTNVYDFARAGCRV